MSFILTHILTQSHVRHWLEPINIAIFICLQLWIFSFFYVLITYISVVHTNCTCNPYRNSASGNNYNHIRKHFKNAINGHGRRHTSALGCLRLLLIFSVHGHPFVRLIVAGRRPLRQATWKEHKTGAAVTRKDPLKMAAYRCDGGLTFVQTSKLS